MRVTLAARLLLWVGVPAAALYVLIVVLSSLHTRKQVLRETEQSSRHLARYHAQRIENRLGRAAVIAEMIAGEMEDDPKLVTADLYSFLRNVVRRRPLIYGSCIAFERYSYDPAIEYLAPYYYWKNGQPEFVQLGNPDYNYFKWEWYDAPKRAGAARWSEPYYDEGGGEAVMTTYSVPFFRGGTFWGIATIDIAMNELTRDVDEIKVGTSGYAFIVSKGGKFLAFPDKSKILRGSLFESHPELAKQITSGGDGFIRAVDPWKNQAARIAFVPIGTGDLSLGVVYPLDELMAQATAVQFHLVILGILGLVGLVAMLIIMVRSFSRPISALANAAQRIAAGDLDVQIDAHSQTREIGHLTEAFQTMTADLKARLQQLQHATAAQERFEGELAAARTIQTSLLPVQFPLFPEHKEIAIHANLRSAHDVGGDFYNCYFVDREWLCLVLGDVSGKGVPAALFMAVALTMIKAHSSGTFSPARILGRVNRELAWQNETGMFVTIFCALLNIRSGSLVYCNAGHNPPFLLSRTGAVVKLDQRGGPALGAIDDAWYEDGETRLRPGDGFFAYTDGVTEAMNAAGEFYGERRLIETLSSGEADLDPEVLDQKIIDDVTTFAKGSPQADDITVLTLRFLGERPTPDRGAPSPVPLSAAQ